MLCLFGVYILQAGSVKQPRRADVGLVPTGKPVASYAKLPLSFEVTLGQTDKQVKFLSRGPGYTLFLAGNEMALELQKPEVRSRQSATRQVATMKALPRKENGERRD